MNKHVHVCIMAGGAGTRFWPMSVEEKPKQFIDVLGNGRSLLQMTYDRALALVPSSQIWIMTHAKYQDEVSSQLPDLNVSNILLEPERKNTAPAIAYACIKLMARDPESVMVLLSSDHVILKEEAFKNDLQTGIDCVEAHDAIFTLGIQPTEPHTGYGYIQFDAGEESVKKVKRFVEKPALPQAKEYYLSGDYLWNAGIFIWHTKRIWEELRNHSAGIFEAFKKVQDHISTSNESRAVEDAFKETPSESIDYAVMEKVVGIYTKPSDIGWSDLGTWGSLYGLIEKNEDGNAFSFDNNLILENVQNSLIKLPKGQNAIIRGLDGFVVAWQDGGLLIYPIIEEQSIKRSLKSLGEIRST